MNVPSSDKLAELEKRMLKLGIKQNDLHEQFILGSGSGGQKLNKTSSCVYLLHIPSGIEIKCQKTRSRELNRFYARRELCEQLESILFNTPTKKELLIEKKKKQKKRRASRSKIGKTFRCL